MTSREHKYHQLKKMFPKGINFTMTKNHYFDDVHLFMDYVFKPKEDPIIQGLKIEYITPETKKDHSSSTMSWDEAMNQVTLEGLEKLKQRAQEQLGGLNTLHKLLGIEPWEKTLLKMRNKQSNT